MTGPKNGPFVINKFFVLTHQDRQLNLFLKLALVLKLDIVVTVNVSQVK